MNYLENIKFSDFSSICRICLKKEDLQDIFKSVVNSIKIVDIFQIVFNEQLAKDEKPQKICKTCTDQLIEVEKFFKLYHDSQMLLETILDLKKEPSDDKLNTYQSNMNFIINIKEEQVDLNDKTEWICQLCNFNNTFDANTKNNNLNKKKSLQEHIRIEHLLEITENRCLKCGNGFSNLTELQNHFFTSKHQNKTCPKCKSKFNTIKDSFIHSQSCDLMSNQADEFYNCINCKVKLNSFENVLKHYKKAHKTINSKCSKSGSAQIPEHSKERYTKVYMAFKNWCLKKSLQTTENSIMEYMMDRSSSLKSPGSLWAQYSMLKTTIFLHEDIDISKYSTLVSFLKNQSRGHKSKKANAFQKHEIERFLLEAPDYDYLPIKVGMIIGIAGVCKREELYNVMLTDIQDKDTFFIVNIPESKNGKNRSFTIINCDHGGIQYADIVKRYLQFRLKNTLTAPRLFLSFHHGKCNNQVIGINTIGNWPKKVAQYLKLEDPNGYTGHSFRRTSTALMADKGLNIMRL